MSARKFFLGLLGLVVVGLGIKKVKAQAAKGIVSRSSNQVGSRPEKKVGAHERA